MQNQRIYFRELSGSEGISSLMNNAFNKAEFRQITDNSSIYVKKTGEIAKLTLCQDGDSI